MYLMFCIYSCNCIDNLKKKHKNITIKFSLLKTETINYTIRNYVQNYNYLSLARGLTSALPIFEIISVICINLIINKYSVIANLRY